MHLLLKTRVNQPLTKVWQGFDSSLFDRLSPPFPPVEVMRFDGCLKGDVVHLRLNFLLFRQDWISLIVDQQTTDNEIYFVDQGLAFLFSGLLAAPSPALRNSDGGTIIIDDIVFRTPFRFTDLLIYPLLWLLFAYRKPIYKRTFK